MRLGPAALAIALSMSAGLAAADAGDDPVVAKVGDDAIHASLVQKALVGVPAFELSALGTTKLDILHRYVDEAMVKPELLARAAKQKGALDDRAVAMQIAKVYAAALVRKELAPLGDVKDVPMSEVQAYYDAHVDAYKTPERVRVLHIALADEAKAEEVLALAKKDGPTREGWRALVAKYTLDPTNKYSDGSLGWVSADGKTEEAKVTVPAEIAKATFALKDGELSAAPVEATINNVRTFHVLWRVQSTPAMVRTVAQEAATIQMLLFEQKRKAAYEALVAKLRGGRDVTFDEDLLPLVQINFGPRPAPKPH